jgi:hypothetical protein
MTDLFTILAPLAIWTLLIVIINQRQAIKSLTLRERLAQSKYQLLRAFVSDE